MATTSELPRIDVGDGHRHLPMTGAAPARRDRGARYAVVALAIATVALYAAAYFLPWWGITLFAPQYPKGLGLTISLTGLGGDVREIDMLNHYIGMAPLGEAAALERRLAGYGVGAVGVVVIAVALASGRRLNGLLAAVGLLFPAGFLADSFYWMYSFGHHLNPKAPLRMKPFTPELFGAGTIGQFRTIAAPESGFWLAAAGVLLLVAAFLVRRRVCAGCRDAASCGAVCPRLLVGPERRAKGEES